MLQEHNIRDIKVLRLFPLCFKLFMLILSNYQSTFEVHGPYATWEYIKKISASIPTQRKIKDHVEAELNHFYRGKSHTSPNKEKDVARLQASYKSSNIHVYTPKRHLEASQRAEDYIAIGCDATKLSNTIDRWAKRRLVSRAKTEMWGEDFNNYFDTEATMTPDE
jgi:hypothetical protein